MCPTEVLAALLVALPVLFAGRASGLDNGLRLPPAGWSSWYETFLFLLKSQS